MIFNPAISSGGGGIETVTGSIPSVNPFMVYSISYTDADGNYISGRPGSTTITVLKNTIVLFSGSAPVMNEYDFGGAVVDVLAPSSSIDGSYIKLATVTGDFTIS